MKLKAKSKKIFTVSGKEVPSMKTRFEAIVKDDIVPIRIKAGYNNIIIGVLNKGMTISVCDSIKSKAGNTWYYIRHDGVLGFVSAKRVKEKIPSNAEKYVALLETYSKFIKKYYKKFKYKYDSKIKTFAIVKFDIKDGKTVHITCVSPGRWGLHDLGIKQPNGDSLIYGENGHFKNFNGNASDYFKHITKGGPVGKTCEEAIDKGLLLLGDIVVLEGHTHTSSYSGKDYIFYDSGRTTFNNGLKKTGIKIDYHKEGRYKKDVISEVLRWR